LGWLDAGQSVKATAPYDVYEQCFDQIISGMARGHTYGPETPGFGSERLVPNGSGC
jgi:hypothetical protein